MPIFLIIMVVVIVIATVIQSGNTSKENVENRDFTPKKSVHEIKTAQPKEITHQNASALLDSTDWNAFHNNKTNREHYGYLVAINDFYRKVTSKKDYFGWEADRVITLCQSDIKIAPQFIALCNEYKQEIPTYPAFKILAMLYEKRQEYDCAATVCVEAIKLGFVDDGTKGSMYGRLKKMLKLAGLDIDTEQYLKDNL